MDVGGPPSVLKVFLSCLTRNYVVQYLYEGISGLATV